MSSPAGAGGEPPRMRELSRIMGIFWDPKPVYQDLAARPRWLVPLIISIILAVCFLYMFSHVVGWETFLEQQFKNNPRLRDMPADQQRSLIQQQAKVVGITTYVAAVLGSPIFCLLIAALLMLAFRTLAGADVQFKQAFSITCYSFLPNALAAILGIVVMRMVNPADFDLQNPVALNAGWLVNPETSPKWLHALGTSFDLFSIWVMLLLALGFSVAARKLHYTKALTIVVLLWLVWVAVKVGWTAAFS